MLALVCGCLLSGLVVSTGATAVMRRLAPRWGLVDRPNARKVHSVPTPLGGGIGILLGVVLPLLAVQGLSWWSAATGQAPGWLPSVLARHLPGLAARSGQLWSIVAAGGLTSALGLIDDLRPLQW